MRRSLGAYPYQQSIEAHLVFKMADFVSRWFIFVISQNSSVTTEERKAQSNSIEHDSTECITVVSGS